MAVKLLRNTRLWVSTVLSGHDTTNTWEIQVQDDLSFNQNPTSSDIELEEAGATPTRGSARFNDALEPADWTFSTYIRSYLVDPDSTPDSGDEYQFTPDALLWHSLASGSPFDVTSAAGVHSNPVNMLLDFKDSQHHELLKFHVYMNVDGAWYVIENCQVGEATISNDIDGIGSTTWTGQGTLLSELPSQPFDPANVLSVDCNLQASYIRNKLTVLRVTDNRNSNTAYDIAITGGSITFTNNITFLTPSTLSCLDVPIGSYTGSLSITGEMTAYLDDKTNGSKKLLADMLQQKSVTSSFEIAVIMGGVASSGTAPAAVIVLPTAHLDVPSIESADVISTSLSFKGIPTDFSAGDEAFLGFSDRFTSAEIDRLINTGDGEA
ncbi:major tail protein [Vibrio phage VspSw_1]|uniref:Major tail protein n=1 Tax=Vibrio phage VspSw_1 TaxID=2484249 RepID=A0A411BKZ0_9CAUD|nr:major tail protein [Vibrio phage VspSw_1]QAY02222.1 major tail protein [Vibrio phage VspSw_1]